jgi:hypothetical protein
MAGLGRKRGDSRQPTEIAPDNLPPGLISLPKSALTRRRLLTTGAKIGAVLSVLPGAVAGLGARAAEAASYSCLPGSVRDLSYHCYVSCVGPCSAYYSGCNSQPGQNQNTIVCVSGFGTGTPARAVAVCNTSHPHSTGYGCCVYC